MGAPKLLIVLGGSKVISVCWNIRNGRGSVASWTTCLTTEQEILGSHSAVLSEFTKAGSLMGIVEKHITNYFENLSMGLVRSLSLLKEQKFDGQTELHHTLS